MGSQPISSVFPKKKLYNLKSYPLDLYECQNCKLVQFSKLAPLEDMYGQTYGYRTSLSNLMIDHMHSKYLNILKNNFLKKNDNILDIGSNDGTFLNFFAKKNLYNLYGIDPSAEKFKNYYNKNIKLIYNFFSKKNLFTNIYSRKIKFNLITSFAMFYDIEDPNNFCKDIKDLLSDNGVWILELSYFPLLLKNLTYDQICHEHVTYYTLTTFQKILNNNGMQILNFSFNEINGGSIEIICAKKISKRKPQYKKIKKIINEEKKINSFAYKRLNQRIENTKRIINLLLNKINRKDIIGYGASTKGNIILNQCKVTSSQLRYICDANPYKYKKFTPGSNIEIISKERMRALKPKYLLVLIWSFRSEVIRQEIKYLKSGGKLIFHLPMLHIVDKNNYKDFIDKYFTIL
jgi:NDP-4-keto-2,6-dideoxyhexose 3-C-methyltransferase